MNRLDTPPENRGLPLSSLGLRASEVPAIVLDDVQVSGRVGCRLVDVAAGARPLEADPAFEASEDSTAWPDAGADSLTSDVVRPFVRTRGASSVLVDLRLESLVCAVEETDAVTPDDVRSVDDQRIVRLCRTPRSVAEIVVLLGVPLTLIKIMVTDAVRRGLLIVHIGRGSTSSGRPSQELLERLRDGLLRMV